MSTVKPRLSVRYQGLPVRSYLLDKECVTIGRRSGNDIQLDDPAVSGLHARLRLIPCPWLEGCASVHLEDAQSTNGTLVNGERVTRRRLEPGDLIALGHHELVFDEADAALATTLLLLSE
jgi:pSer/pThr/pTyr-binding forkhead associated (FHA) protein